MGHSPATRRPARGGWPLAVGTRPQTKNNPATNQPAGIAKLRRPFSQHAAPGRARVERPRARRLRTQKKNRDHPRGREIAKVSSQTPGEEKRMITSRFFLSCHAVVFGVGGTFN